MRREPIYFYSRWNENIRIKKIILMIIFDKNNETNNFSPMNQSTESPNIFQLIYHSIKDLIKAGQHDIFTIDGKIITSI
jgi:hypothetical protein